MRTLSLASARRLALAAGGLDRARPSGRIDVRHLRRVLDHLDVVQLDSVNVLTRAHELPFFSRLGPVDRERLRRWLWLSREVHECWAHVASVMASEAVPLLRHRQAEVHPWRSVQRLAEEAPGYVEQVRDQVRRDGPLSVSDLDEPGGRGGSWWGWSPGKVALHWLFVKGEVAVHERTPTFLTVYDVPERVLPARYREAEAVPRAEAQRRLLLRAAAAQGVGTAPDLADHHRLPIVEARRHVADLAAEGALEEVEVAGWREPAYRLPGARVPRRVAARALLSPFDPLVWYRDRVERLFGFRYRIEIYVPAAQREHGYYVLPFLLGDRLVARVDLKADRASGRLRVQGAFAEPDVDRVRVAGELAAELRLMADWLDLGEVEVVDNGDLATGLGARV